VADATVSAAGTFAGIDRELALCGALMHDIGKLDAYSGDACGARLNDAGRLIGEIPSGYYTVGRAIEQIPDFPPELAQALLHIILSHHGCLEHGSPVLPSTREALVVHVMDKLSGDLGSFDRLEGETAEDETWSCFDRALGRAVLLADRETSPQTDESKWEDEMARRTLTSTLYRAARISATGRAVRTGHAGRRAKEHHRRSRARTLGVLALALEVASRSQNR
jgi:hypothetical protein